jgi:hypothetical protein
MSKRNKWTPDDDLSFALICVVALGATFTIAWMIANLGVPWV